MSTARSSALAFDLGASSGRAILGILDDGRLHIETLHRFVTPILEREDHLYWDLDLIEAELRTGLRLALDRDPDLASLSVDSWGVDYVPLDAEGRPLRRAFCYRDERTRDDYEEALRRVAPEEIYAATGIQFMAINTLYQILDDRRRDPDQLERTANRLTIADYLNHRLGGRPVAEVSLASTTQLMDVHRQTWSDRLLRAFELPLNGWPEIVPSGTLLGPATEAPGAQVVAGCSHDTACAVVATPAGTHDPSWCYISCGTWSLLGVERTEPLLTDAARSLGFTNEAGAGGTIRFLKNLTGLWALQECVREWDLDGADVYARLMQEAEMSAPSPEPLDLEAPEFRARGGMEARIREACRARSLPVPHTRGAVTRLILDSIADSYRRSLGDLETVLGKDIDVVHLVGGGSQNTLLCRLTAERTGRRVVAGPAEATALGNLLVQFQALGALPEGTTMRDLVRASFTLRNYEPTAPDRA